MEVVSKQKVKVEMNGTNSEQPKLTLSGTVLSLWQDVDWQKVNVDVRRLRQRIFVASKQGDLKKVGSLQKLMLRSRSNWLKSIRQVTQINKGRRTPGVDREVITTPAERVELFYWLGTFPLNEWKPPPVKRVEIPKDNGKTRPLGIPTVRDRVIQAIVKNALEPYWEAKFEGTSYGFRPGRSTHDAVESIWQAENRGQRPWIVDADIKGAFDNIAHEPLMEAIGLFPGRFLIRKWLKAGVMKNLVLAPSETGTPQGGVISPLLANIALHGMEEALDVKYKFKRDKNGQVYQNVISPVKVVRFADDFVILTETEAQAIEARDRIAQWLKTKGLELSAEKTHITTLESGFDFLGFTIIRRKNALSKAGYATHVFPSKKSVTKFKKKVKEIATRGQAYKTETIIVELNPLITGWAYYY